MAKNNAFINAMKIAHKQAQDVTPAIYASVALALHREYGFGYERINKVFIESQNIWTQFAGTVGDMINLCETETGIKLERK